MNSWPGGRRKRFLGLLNSTAPPVHANGLTITIITSGKNGNIQPPRALVTLSLVGCPYNNSLIIFILYHLSSQSHYYPPLRYTNFNQDYNKFFFFGFSY